MIIPALIRRVKACTITISNMRDHAAVCPAGIELLRRQ
jgi:hypothetical protein